MCIGRTDLSGARLVGGWGRSALLCVLLSLGSFALGDAFVFSVMQFMPLCLLFRIKAGEKNSDGIM